MSGKYLNIDSTYRNRVLYPNPADFQTSFQNLDNRSVKSSLYYPIPIYTNTFFYPVRQIDDKILQIEPLKTGNQLQDFILRFQETDNIFNGQYLELFNDDPQINGNNITVTTLTKIISTKFEEIPTILQSGTITGGTFLRTLQSTFTISGGTDIDHYYIGKTMIIKNLTLSNTEYRVTVVQYQNGQVTVDRPVLFQNGDNVTYDMVSLQQWYVITEDNIVPTDDIEYPQRQQDYPQYTRNLIRIRNSNQIFFRGIVAAGDNSTSTIQFSSNASSIDHFYSEKWLWNTTENSTDSNKYAYIIDYNGSTKVAEIVKDSFSTALSENDTFEILDDYLETSRKLNTLNSNKNQQVCYDITLKHLILPNIPLSTDQGDRIAFYPYVYLEFYSTIKESFKNIMLTNVPNLKNVLFKIPIYNVITPNISTFIVLKSNMTQRIKFNLYDNFQFRVLLPNLDIFTTNQPDSTIPNLPLEEVQISALFELNKVEI